jgi:putative flippase GtrA
MAPARTFFQFFTFAAVGAVGTALHYAILFGCVSGFGWAPEPATALGALAGAGANYLLNRRFTFESARGHASAFPRFLLVAGAGMAANVALVALATRAIGWPLLPAQVAATIVVLIGGFFANRAWTFGISSHE